MQNVNIAWVLPNTRASGKPLAVADIAGVELEISADLGANWASLGRYPPDLLTTTVTDLEPGEWQFRGTVVDTMQRRSPPVAASIVLEDTSPPTALLALTLSL